MKTHGISESIKSEIAKAMVRESHPGYMRSYQGESYVVDTDGDQEFDAVWFKEGAAQWSPWPDDAIAVPVWALYEYCAGDVDFSPALDPTEAEKMTDEERDEAEDQAQAAAELLALEYLPEYYPNVDVNEDDDEIELPAEVLAEQELEQEYAALDAEERSRRKWNSHNDW